ncbi:uncharacterized protein LOC6649575 [Drosophila willistoni]|nr:uncharacterized protein LOC6649575 [Drosophila willistoni]
MCYCRGHKPNGYSNLHSLTSSSAASRQSSQHLPTTQFVKKPSLKTGLGLGHSRSDLSPNYSRRNSDVSHCSSCSCSSSPIQQQQRQHSCNKVLTWGWEREELSEGINTQYTDNRRLYEQSACVANRLPMTLNQGQCQGRSPTPTKSKSDKNDGLRQLRSLQQFRLSNAMDCFSEKRQDELRLQQAYDKLDRNKWQKNKANISTQQAKLTEPTTTAPYAWRQKLLQWQLQREAQNVEARGEVGVGSSATCAPLEKSCALRYNCY